MKRTHAIDGITYEVESYRPTPGVGDFGAHETRVAVLRFRPISVGGRPIPESENLAIVLDIEERELG